MMCYRIILSKLSSKSTLSQVTATTAVTDRSALLKKKEKNRAAYSHQMIGLN